MAVPLLIDMVFWIALFMGTAMLLFTMVYALVLLGDLSRDLINPIELCELINRIVPLEYAGHAALALLLLLRGYWVTALLHVPLVAFHVSRVRARTHLLDNTAIFADIPKARREREVKTGFYLFTFFLYLYHFIFYLIDD